MSEKAAARDLQAIAKPEHRLQAVYASRISDSPVPLLAARTAAKGQNRQTEMAAPAAVKVCYWRTPHRGLQVLTGLCRRRIYHQQWFDALSETAGDPDLPMSQA